MVRVLHHAPRSRIRLGRRGLVLVIFADCDVVYNRRTAKRVVVMMVVRGGIAEAGGAREVRGGFLHLPRRIALFDRSSAAVVVVGTGDCRDVRGIDGAIISRSGGFGSSLILGSGGDDLHVRTRGRCYSGGGEGRATRVLAVSRHALTAGLHAQHLLLVDAGYLLELTPRGVRRRGVNVVFVGLDGGLVQQQ